MFGGLETAVVVGVAGLGLVVVVVVGLGGLVGGLGGLGLALHLAKLGRSVRALGHPGEGRPAREAPLLVRVHPIRRHLSDQCLFFIV